MIMELILKNNWTLFLKDIQFSQKSKVSSLLVLFLQLQIQQVKVNMNDVWLQEKGTWAVTCGMKIQ